MAGSSSVSLRGVDPEALRLAKAEATRTGRPLGRVVSDALRKALATRREETPDAEADESPLADDQAWFEKNRSRLYKKYPDQYVAIIGRRVVAHGPQFDGFASRVYAKYGFRPILMPKVTRQPRVIHLRSPRIVR